MQSVAAQMATPISGIRIYRYADSAGTRIAIHLPPGAHTIDISKAEAQRLAEDLTQLAS